MASLLPYSILIADEYGPAAGEYDSVLLDEVTHAYHVYLHSSSPHCPFRIRCNFNEKAGGATITTLHNVHDCATNSPYQPSPNVSRAETSKLKFLLEAVPPLLAVDQSTPTKLILDAVKQKYGTEIALRQAQKVKAALCSRLQEPSELTEQYSRNDRYSNGDDEPHNPSTTDPPIMNDNSDMQVDFDDGDTVQIGQNRLTGDEDLSSPSGHDLSSNASVAMPPTSLQTRNGQNSVLHSFQQPPVIPSALQTYLGATMATKSAVAARSLNDKTPREIRAEAAVLFQRASEKFQEATYLHAEATRLFASVANS